MNNKLMCRNPKNNARVWTQCVSHKINVSVPGCKKYASGINSECKTTSEIQHNTCTWLMSIWKTKVKRQMLEMGAGRGAPNSTESSKHTYKRYFLAQTVEQRRNHHKLNYGWTRKWGSLRTTLSILEKEVQLKSRLGPTNLKYSHWVSWNIPQFDLMSIVWKCQKCL